MGTLISLKNSLLSTWKAGLPSKELPVTQVLSDRLESITTAILTAGDITIKATTINGGLITGGASASGGPVTGAILNIAPGGLVSATKWSGKNVYIPPTTQIGQSPVKYTDWLKTLQETISDAVSDFWDSWYPTWTCAGATALGGVSAWVATSTPPVPGPWTMGTITPFSLVGAQGVNASPALTLLKTKLVTTAKTTPVTTWNNQTSTLIPAQNGDVIQGTIEAFCDAFSSTFQAWTTTAMVTDITGVGASGIAAPPTGIITTGTINGLMII